jgi:hypothetical protein
MSNRNGDAGLTMGKRLWYIQGSFETNGSSNPPTATLKGFGFTAVPPVHTATGTYLVTMDDNYQDLNAMGCDLQVTGASPNWVQPSAVQGLGVQFVGPGPNLTKPTVQLITINASGVAVDIARDGVNGYSRVHFFFCFRDSTVQYAKP